MTFNPYSAGNVSRSLAVLSGNEENSALSGAIAQLSEVQKSMEQVWISPVTLFLSKLPKS